MVISVKSFVLSTLYFCQGLPYGLQEKLLPIILRSKGSSYTDISLIRLLWLPWMFKVLFAPFVDKVWSKEQWLYMCLGVLCLLSIITSFIDPEKLFYLSVLIFLFNVFSAVQDISVDGLAIDILDDTELGAGNSAQVGGYKLGSLFGGGVLYWVIHSFGWSSAYLGLALIYLVIAAASFSVLRKKHEFVKMKKDNESKKKYARSSKSRRWQHVLKEILIHTGTLEVAGFALVYKLGEQSALANFPMFLLDKQMDPGTLSFWYGVVGQLLSLTGSVLGGIFLTNSRDVHKVLQLFCWLRTVPLVTQWCIISLWPSDFTDPSIAIFYGISISALCCLQFLGGVVTTATFTLMMSCSQKAQSHLQATHFTTLASLEVFGKLCFVTFIGTLMDVVEAPVIYFVFVVLNISAAVCIPNHK